jgi:hypothetical protein
MRRDRLEFLAARARADLGRGLDFQRDTARGAGDDSLIAEEEMSGGSGEVGTTVNASLDSAGPLVRISTALDSAPDSFPNVANYPVPPIIPHGIQGSTRP